MVSVSFFSGCVSTFLFKKTLWTPFMNRVQLSQDCRATMSRQYALNK